MIKSISLCVLAIVWMCGCSSQLPSVQADDKSLSPYSPSVSLSVASPSPEASHDMVILPVSPAIEAYKKVLNNEVDFFHIGLQRNIYLQDYCIEECTIDDFIKYFSFSFVNMVGGDVPEVILYIGPPGINLIFHYENGKVYSIWR